MKNSKNEKTLVILDAHALIHRSYHAMPSFTSSSGEPMGAVYGVSAVLLKLIRDLEPTHMAAAFDRPEPTFRHVAYEDYKATRAETKSDLVPQFDKVKEVFSAFGISMFDVAGFEADDIIGTLVERFKKAKNLRIVIASGDMDTLQLVEDDRVTVYTLRKGIEDTIVYNEKKVNERFGFGPALIPDFKGLKGDPSDNIIGVKGIGEKTATELIVHYGSIEKMYEALKREKKHPGWLRERILALLLENEEEALFSKELALIRLDAPVGPSLEELAYPAIPYESAARVFRKFHFASLLSRLDELTENKEEKKEIEAEDFKKSDWNEIDKISRLFLFMAEGKLFLGHEKNMLVVGAEQVSSQRKQLEEFFAGRREIIVHDAKAIFRFLGFSFPVSFDLSLAAWLLNPERRLFELQDLLHEELSTGAELPDAGFQLEKKLRTRIEKENLAKIIFEFELPLTPVLFMMERRGILIDTEKLKVLEIRVGKDLAVLERDIWKQAGEKFDIGSPKQLARILFEVLGLSPKGIKKTSTKNISTQFSELVKLRDLHPIIESIIRYREYSKLSSTYVSVLPGLADARGRLHTTYNQTGAATGRLSSLNPNLQNIPIRTELGREIRQAFMAEKGYELVSFDYSQLELRIAAAFSNDPKLVDAFKKGEDVHIRTAAEIFNVAKESVTPEMRRRAKTINFGILYGMGSRSLAQAMKVSHEEADKYLRDYLANFPGIEDYRRNLIEEARKTGYVKTLFGRRRYFQNLRSTFVYVRSEAERMAINAPIQGTEADLIKRAMIGIAKEFKNEDVRMLLQVHDELLFEMKKNLIPTVVPNIKAIMEKVPELSVPIVVDVKRGSNWQDMTKMP